MQFACVGPFACAMPKRRMSCNLLITKLLHSFTSACCLELFPRLGYAHSNPGKKKVARFRADTIAPVRWWVQPRELPLNEQGSDIVGLWTTLTTETETPAPTEPRRTSRSSN